MDGNTHCSNFQMTVPIYSIIEYGCVRCPSRKQKLSILSRRRFRGGDQVLSKQLKVLEESAVSWAFQDDSKPLANLTHQGIFRSLRQSGRWEFQMLPLEHQMWPEHSMNAMVQESQRCHYYYGKYHCCHCPWTMWMLIPGL